VSPLVSTQFQFADVGVNVSLVPKVHANNEISLHIELEISSVRDRIDIGGLSQPVIGQRKVTHDIRIKEGEVTLLGGLMQSQDTKTRGGIPGISSIPVLRNIFGTNSTEKNDGELMIALVPHIVRSPEYTENNLRPVATGNDQTVKLSYAHEAPAAEGKTAAPATGQTPAAAPEAPAPPAPEAPKPTAPPAAAQPRMAFNVPAQEARLGSAVTLTLSVENATDLFSAPLRLKFDPKVLRLSEVAKGGFLSGDGQNIIFTRNIQNDVGEVTVNLNRLPGSGGISGGGALVTLVFQAAGPGASKVFVSEAPLRNSQLQPIVLPAPETTITVK
jgi:general secretion pathway protein D